ncbi:MULTISPECIES: M23 family metallopeptidase [unclassified Caulobacter]|uniref:M23 family metallopeptidase n=1 Tax=Caulobacter sp. HMWF009 TaxID=2056846 RepID=UPI000D3777BE|nr:MULTISPECIES: M23 family metallopeptidase [unclassified Caulobacter]PTS88494.1 M23 family peptidase [Caulobacter sp. HMWF009]PTT09735.1 M23 family peptidase [Caulobacter sp. HMWF025]
MSSEAPAAAPPYSRVAFLALVGVLSTVGLLNAGSALRAFAAEPARTEPITEPDTVESAPEPLPAFVFDAPLPGHVINSPFGLRQLPWEENGRLHEGVDIAAPEGSAIRAASDGVVLRTGVNGSYGRFVELGHKDGFRTLYAHLGATARDVKRGQYARRGQTIAYVGNSGRSTGAHLHFEIRRKGKPLNPTFFLGQSFAAAEDLPLKAAARVPRKVHLATVSAWPESVKAARARLARQQARLAASDG